MAICLKLRWLLLAITILKTLCFSAIHPSINRNLYTNKNLIHENHSIHNYNIANNNWKYLPRKALDAARVALKQKPKKYKIEFTATNALIAMNIVAFALTTWIKPSLKYRYMKIDRLIARGDSYRLFSSVFLHGSIMHLLANCYSLNQIGPQVVEYPLIKLQT